MHVAAMTNITPTLDIDTANKSGDSGMAAPVATPTAVENGENLPLKQPQVKRAKWHLGLFAQACMHARIS
jgi:hypothetical protein